MNVLLDGVLAFLTYAREISFFFIAILGLGYFSIKSILSDETSLEIKLLMAFSVGSAALCLMSFVLVVATHFYPFLLRPGSYMIFLVSSLALLRGVWSKDILVPRGIHIVLGISFLFFLLVIRLAFLRHIILPPYSDSPIHYQIMIGFLDPDAINASKLSVTNIFSDYYHFGFHSLAVWLVSVTKIEPVKAISLLGQLFLVMGPISLLSLVYAITRNTIGALFAGLLAAIGWYMPAFAVNWGKYPALSALAIFPSLLAIQFVRSHERATKNTRLLLSFVLLAGVALLHTRIVICGFLTIFCFYLSKKIITVERLTFFHSIGYSLLFIISLWPLLQPLTDFYGRWLILIILIILVPFAFQMYPRFSTGLFLFMFGLWLAWIYPNFFDNSFPPLLDRQFIGIMLYIPLSVIGGVGLAGLLKKELFNGILRYSIVITLVLCVVLSVIQGNSVYPDSCCDYFGKSDQLVFQWLQENIPRDTLILISAFEKSGQFVGTDAGIWLFPLLRQPSNKLPFNVNWNSPEEIEKICQIGAKNLYIYMGGRVYSFDNTQLVRLVKEKVLGVVFQSGKTAVYQVLKCPD